MSSTAVHPTDHHQDMYNGFDWYGRTLEVREVGPKHEATRRVELTQCAQDRYAGLSGPGSYRGGLRGIRGGYRGGLRGGLRGSYRGGYGGGREFSDGLYAPYSGPDQAGGAMNGYDASYGAGYGGFEPEPSQQIMVRNVSADDPSCGTQTDAVNPSYPGPPPTKIWWSSLRPLAR